MNPYRTDPLTDIVGWNALLATACPACCEMPECPEPEVECESETRSDARDLLVPFVEPEYDLIETLYEEISSSANFYYEGTAWRKLINVGVDFQSEELHITTFAEGPDGEDWVANTVATKNLSDDLVPSCGPIAVTPQDFNPAINPEFSEVSEGWICEETFSRWQRIESSVSGGALALVGCPAPWAAESVTTESWDLLRITYDGYRLSSQVTYTDMRTAAVSLLDGTWQPGGCEASVVVAHNPFQASQGWPKKSTLPASPWDQCDGSTVGVPVWVHATKSRFRYTVPESHTGTYYRVLWDILEEPTGWDATIPDPENPEGPEIPDPDRPARSFSARDEEWVWEGAENRTSDWQVIAPPSVPGTRRAVNGRIYCYRGPFGSLPTLFGEQIERLDAEMDGAPVLTPIDLGQLPSMPPP